MRGDRHDVRGAARALHLGDEDPRLDVEADQLALARVAAPLLPGMYYEALTVAAIGWIVAFGGFVIVYGPMLLRPRASS